MSSDFSFEYESMSHEQRMRNLVAKDKELESLRARVKAQSERIEWMAADQLKYRDEAESKLAVAVDALDMITLTTASQPKEQLYGFIWRKGHEALALISSPDLLARRDAEKAVIEAARKYDRGWESVGFKAPATYQEHEELRATLARLDALGDK